MNNLAQLNLLFTQNLNLNLARVKALSMMVLALLEARDIRLSTLSRYFSLSDAQAESSFKRMQRFIKEVKLPFDAIARLVPTILGIAGDAKLTLIFDRTNWKFGKVHINFLFLAIAHKGIAIPLFWKVLSKQKRGNSTFFDRIDLVEKFIGVFGKERLDCLLGDREFVGKCWIMWLRRKRLPFVMRLPDNLTHISDSKGKPSKAKHMFEHLRQGSSRSLGFCSVVVVEPYKAQISVLKTTDGEMVVLLHSEHMRDPAEIYLKRWQIETMFRAFKTSGFNLESTHVTNPDRLAQLMAVLVLAFCFAYKAGKIVESKKKSSKE
jgi:transposase